MDNDRKPDEVTPQTARHGLLMILFSAMGAIELWLWKIGHTNQYGLYIGLAFIVGAALSALQYVKYRKKV